MKSLRLPVLVLLLAGSAMADDLTVHPGFADDHWLHQDESFDLVLNRPPAAAEGRLALFIDQTDVSSLVSSDGATYTYDAGALALPSGEHEMVVYLVSPAGEWTEINRSPLRVLSRHGFKTATVSPAVDLSNKGQLNEAHDPADNAPQRDKFQDGTMQVALRTHHETPAISLSSETQMTGVTFQNEALRFGTEGDKAPLFDLASYRLDFQKGSTLLSVGHVAFGTMRQLVNSFGSRGVAVTLGQGRPVSLQLAAMNGSSIAGWDNIVGLNNAHHQVIGATVGLEMIPSRPGGLRLETTLFGGALQPDSGFNQGAVLASEKSRGAGLRLIAADPGQRFTIDAGFTESQFHAAEDPQLEEGLQVTPLPERRRSALYADAVIGILKEHKLSERTNLTLTLNLHHERIDPLFRSVGASVSPDINVDAADLVLGLGMLSAQLTHFRSRDNLDNIESILTTKTNRTAFTIGIPIAGIFGITGPKATWIPAMSLQADTTHQFGDGIPVNGDFSPTNVPDQVSDNGTVSLDWQIGRFRAGYHLGGTRQDNRQPTRERSDFNTRTHAVSLGFAPTQRLGVGIDVSLDDNHSVEEGKTVRNERYGTNVSWTLFGQTAISANVGKTLSHDSLETSDQHGLDGFLELSSGFRLSRGASQKRPGRVFLRYSDQRLRTSDSIFGIQSDRSGAAVTSGVSLSLF